MRPKPLKSWRDLNAALYRLTEAEVSELLEYERNNQRRMSMLSRLHQRFTTLRATRERVEILKEAQEA